MSTRNAVPAAQRLDPLLLGAGPHVRRQWPAAIADVDVALGIRAGEPACRLQHAGIDVARKIEDGTGMRRVAVPYLIERVRGHVGVHDVDVEVEVEVVDEGEPLAAEVELVLEERRVRGPCAPKPSWRSGGTW
jgi:hypothetical protein